MKRYTKNYYHGLFFGFAPVSLKQTGGINPLTINDTREQDQYISIKIKNIFREVFLDKYEDN